MSPFKEGFLYERILYIEPAGTQMTPLTVFSLHVKMVFITTVQNVFSRRDVWLKEGIRDGRRHNGAVAGTVKKSFTPSY